MAENKKTQLKLKLKMTYKNVISANIQKNFFVELKTEKI